MRIAGFDAADLIGGLIVTMGGVAFAIGAATYPIGTLNRMGPGYLPLVTGIVLAGLGLGVIGGGRAAATEIPHLTVRPALAIFAGLLWFALTIERFGLIPCVVGMVVLTSLAQKNPSWVKMLATSTFLVVLSIIVFKYVLNGSLYVIRF
jgi:hypothetical protein